MSLQRGGCGEEGDGDSPQQCPPAVTSLPCPQFSALALKLGLLCYGAQLVATGTVTTGDLVTFLIYQMQFTKALEVSPWGHRVLNILPTVSPSPFPMSPAPSPLCPRASPSVSPWPPMSPCPPHHVPVSSAVSSYPLCHVPTLVPPCPCALPCPPHQVPVSSPSPHPPSGVPMLVPHVPMLSQPCPLCVLRSCSNTTPT